MSLRKSRKRRAAGKAAKAVALFQLVRARKPLAIAAGVLGAVGIAAAAKRRKRDDDLGYGPPNESHPSHETLAPAQAAAS